MIFGFMSISCIICNVYSIKLIELDIQKSSFYSDPRTGLNLELENANVSVSAFASISSSNGTMFVETTGLRLHLGILVKRDDDGQPLFSVTNCSFEAGNYKLYSGEKQLK